MLKKKPCFCEWILLLCHLLLPAFVCSKHHGNPANDLVEIINQNRTAQKLPHLNDSPGLGCMALQYVELCKGNCSGNRAVSCKPPEDDFTEVFAPNCGVELPTIGTITGLIVGCQSKYTEPSLAFADVLVKDKKSLSVVRNRSHSEVGVGLIGFHKGPFFWCVLFSNGGTNSSFVLEDRGEGIKQKKGCYSGSAFPCNAGQRNAYSGPVSDLISSQHNYKWVNKAPKPTKRLENFTNHNHCQSTKVKDLRGRKLRKKMT